MYFINKKQKYWFEINDDFHKNELIQNDINKLIYNLTTPDLYTQLFNHFNLNKIMKQIK